MIMAMVGLVIGIFNYEIDITNNTKAIDITEYRFAIKHPRN